MVNLLDLCAVAIPGSPRRDGLPFGVQLLAPAFADEPLLDLAAHLTGSPHIPVPMRTGHQLVAVCGAHLSGQPLNPVLTDGGARLQRRTRTAGGYRMVHLVGPPPRPGLLDAGDGPAAGLDVELWEAPDELVRRLAVDTEAPLEIGVVRLEDGSQVAGFTAIAGQVGDASDISAGGGWRAHLASLRS